MNNINPLFKELEKEKTAKDIMEIDNLLLIYNQYGYFNQNNRDKAIEKIKDARGHEPVVQITLMPKTPAAAISYELVPDEQLYRELSFIGNYLADKLVAKEVMENQLR
ncbi:MAG: hypothetical protein HDT14_03085 [Oscillibacter sp.]|nr:hypothetical protein [Oscillibacter sp.]